jgi:hypothetical protein
MRLVYGFFTALFIFAAALQYNDPDPVRWAMIYLAAAAVCVLAFARHSWTQAASAGVGAIALVWALTYLPAVLRHGQVLSMFDEWEMKNQEVLENREMFGLLIVAAVMAVVWARSSQRKSAG